MAIFINEEVTVESFEKLNGEFGSFDSDLRKSAAKFTLGGVISLIFESENESDHFGW